MNGGRGSRAIEMLAVAGQPFESFTETEYVPESGTKSVSPEMPVLQLTVAKFAESVSVSTPPESGIVGADAMMDTFGSGLIRTVTVSEYRTQSPKLVVLTK